MCVAVRVAAALLLCDQASHDVDAGRRSARSLSDKGGSHADTVSAGHAREHEAGVGPIVVSDVRIAKPAQADRHGRSGRTDPGASSKPGGCEHQSGHDPVEVSAAAVGVMRQRAVRRARQRAMAARALLCVRDEHHAPDSDFTPFGADSGTARLAGGRPGSQYLGGMAIGRPSPEYDRVVERRRAVAARHFRDAEGLSIAQIAGRLGRSPATIKAYFYDPS